MNYPKISDESILLDNECKKLLKRSSKKIIVDEVMNRLYQDLNSDESDNSNSPNSYKSNNSNDSNNSNKSEISHVTYGSNLSSDSSYITIYSASNNCSKNKRSFYENLLLFCGCKID